MGHNGSQIWHRLAILNTRSKLEVITLKILCDGIKS